MEPAAEGFCSGGERGVGWEPFAESEKREIVCSCRDGGERTREVDSFFFFSFVVVAWSRVASSSSSS